MCLAGSNGMGQAQSQSSSGDCSDCLGGGGAGPGAGYSTYGTLDLFFITLKYNHNLILFKVLIQSEQVRLAN